MYRQQQSTIIGRLVHNPAFRFLEGRLKVCNFGLTVEAEWNDNYTNEQRKRTVWYNVSLRGEDAFHAGATLGKGDLVMVSGALNVSVIDTREGIPEVCLELRAVSVHVVEKQAENEESALHKPRSRPELATLSHVAESQECLGDTGVCGTNLDATELDSDVEWDECQPDNAFEMNQDWDDEDREPDWEDYVWDYNIDLSAHSWPE